MADRLAEASRNAAYKLLEIVAAGSPDAAAKKWLDQWVAKKTKELLKELGWDPDGFVENLIARAFPGQEKTPAAQELKRPLTRSVGAAATARLTTHKP